jgi:tetratricopeptide (TPR) repeat protein
MRNPILSERKAASDELPRAPWVVRHTPLIICVGLVLAVLLAYGDLLKAGGEFSELDDGEYVIDNPQVHAGLTSASVAWAFTTYHARNWHPLTWLSLQLDHELHGLEPAGYRLTNVLLHAANAVLLFLFLKSLMGELWLSALVAGLFALHPLHVESVAWITERKDVLCLMFGLLALLAYGRYARAPSIWRYGPVVVLFALGLMAKPMVVTLPFVLLLMDFWPLRRIKSIASLRWLVVEKAPLLALSLAASLVTMRAQGVAEESLVVPPPLQMRLLNSGLAVAEYVRKSIWPSDLSPMYSRPDDQLPVGEGLCACFAVLLITGTWLVLARQRPYLLVGWLWFLGTLVPVIGIVQVGIQTMADRYTYLPHIGLFIMLVWGLADVLRRVPAALRGLLAAGVLIACFVLTQAQARLWRDNLDLWRHAVSVTENNFAAHRSLGSVLVARGKVNEGIEQYRVALRIEPHYVMGHYYLGQALATQELWAEAVASYSEVIRLAPQMTPAYHELGFCYMRMGHMEEAIEPLRLAASRDTDQPIAHCNLATALIYRDRLDEAKYAAEQAMRLSPRMREAHLLLGLMLALEGDPAQGEPHFLAAGRRTKPSEPSDPAAGYLLAWSLHAQGQVGVAGERFRLANQRYPNWRNETLKEAWRLATHPSPIRRNGRLARLRAEVVNLAQEGKDAQALDTLAAAHAELGDFAEAVKTAKQALERLPSVHPPEMKEQIEKRVRMYEQNQPYRETPLAVTRAGRFRGDIIDRQ